MKSLLVSTDLSPRSDRAVARAFRIAAAHGASLTVLSVVDRDLPERVLAAMTTETRAHLNAICHANPDADTVVWTARVETGDHASDIEEIAAEIRAELIVVGLHRHRALLDSFRATTLEQVLHLSSRPVLLAAQPVTDGYRNVLAPIDFSPAATSALAMARDLAPDATFRTFHAVFTGVSRMDDRDVDRTMARAYLRQVREAMQAWIDQGGLPEGLDTPELIEGALGAIFEREVETRDPDLIVVGAHGRHGLAHWALGGFTRDLVRNPPCDILVAKPE